MIARIPGTANTGAIAINAHYDGGATGPAAGDNGVGVAATLEVVRAVLAGPPLANDVIVVFSDGEENGDLARRHSTNSTRGQRTSGSRSTLRRKAPADRRCCTRPVMRMGG